MLCAPCNALCHCEALPVVVFRTKYFMSLRGIANGDAVAISRKGNRISLDVFKNAQENYIFLKSLYLTNIVC